jgi:ribonucleoside-triphosphate reductase
MDINTRGLMADAKFFESYSRFISEEQRFETWAEAVERVMHTHRIKYKEKLDGNEKLKALFDVVQKAYTEKIILGSQRALQFGGDQLLKHEFRLYNCLGGHANNVNWFGEYFYLLLCGCGVGASVQKHHVARLPMIRPRTKQSKTFVVPDSIEGWAQAIDVLMSSFFMGGGKHPEYEGRKVFFDTSEIREKGAPISGGFKAPGPEPLQRCLAKVERLLNNVAEDGILRPIHVFDIGMYIADAVLSGGVRRAATIFLFSKDDEEMMASKTGNWFVENKQRARANISAVLLRDDTSKEEFETLIANTKEYGEPGFVWVDDLEYCYNPCLEIGFYPIIEIDGKEIHGFQACNLCEINGDLCDTEEKFLYACKMAAIMGTIQAGYTNFKFVSDATRQIIEREALLGVSLTGWMNHPDVLLSEAVMKKGAAVIKETNAYVAKLLGINQAARTTCVKPAGNASVLLRTASGVHAEHAKRYLRTVQMSKMQEVGQIIRDTNAYMVEESVWSADKSDYSIAFPVVAPKGSMFKKDLNAIKFLQIIKSIQVNWVWEGTNEGLCADPKKKVRHNVSNTVHVHPEEWGDVSNFIYDNRDYFTGVSLLSATGEKDYHQAPYQEVKSETELAKMYGPAALFASGLIVDSTNGFDNLWQACDVAMNPNADKSNQETKDTRSDWIRRFNKFAVNHFDGDLKKTSYCLKDVYLLWKWQKIQLNFVDPHLEDRLKIAKSTDIDTMGAVACSAGGCEI